MRMIRHIYDIICLNLIKTNQIKLNYCVIVEAPGSLLIKVLVVLSVGVRIGIREEESFS